MGRIITNLPKDASYTYPDGFKRKGKVLKATEPSYISSPHGDYACRIELMSFEDGPDKFVRFAYYRRPPEKRRDENGWNWAAQWTWSFDVKTTREQVERATAMGLLDA
ncbi:MAG: hypothetical protein JRN23_07065 [Nitrososphaerota archaeon]|jgi:hypothetical protein|nr:hypothetical protein [Nitrososphaerota archaeon]MDG6967502.1 hypothetical protein [Nitrososphaerota archaeon]MDG6978953.1 hypothetical protein [Nitrososphaerota archaeon]MDG7021675.1 hypothetical protein [Nitrososphaerota archaeon]